ncbi:glycosyltransferase [Patulibacter sp. SYSU D01012]|uniref:glycosyltransferase n=1 Tax=Patulibacter sp. SYSU D01012 TaxID=2817381 RepID=UPI001B301B48
MLRVIARMNVGGPAHHVAILSERLDPTRYATVLLTGEVPPSEGSLERLATERGVDVRRVAGLGPALRPLADLRAFVALVGHVHRLRPDVVHTHTAKAGLLGRLAARVVLGRRVTVVHTYHGHVLRGYFGRRTEALFRTLETLLARTTDRLVGVSQATVDELVDLGVAPRDRFSVVPVGLDLDRFLAVTPDPDGLRRQIDAPATALVVAFVGRLAPIKRVDVLLAAVADARRRGADVRLLVAGDGELRADLERQAAPLGAAVRFLGFRDDLPSVAAAADVAALTSDNEGTPVALIEAAAAGVPAIATAVGGVGDIVLDGTTGVLVAPGDVEGFADALVAAAADRQALAAMGAAARRHVGRRYDAARLVRDVDRLYGELLGRPAERPSPAGGRSGGRGARGM